MKKNVLLLETIAEEAMMLLSASENIEIFTAFGDTSLNEILANHSINAVITRGKGQVNTELMDACPHLQVAARCGVGLDNVDVAGATARQIKVVNAPGSNAATIAEHTISLMLLLQRNMYRSINEVKAGNWNWRNKFEGDEVGGKKIGILGLGNIGKKVAKIADALGMNVSYWNRKPLDVPYEYSSLENILKTADIISIHLPFVPETNLLIGAEAFEMMKPNALIINTARGNIIDQDALYKALLNKKIAGFAADVLTQEPPERDMPLLDLPNVLVTAHVGSLTATTYTNMCVSTVKNVLAILEDREPQKECIFNRNDLNG